MYSGTNSQLREHDSQVSVLSSTLLHPPPAARRFLIYTPEPQQKSPPKDLHQLSRPRHFHECYTHSPVTWSSNLVLIFDPHVSLNPTSNHLFSILPWPRPTIICLSLLSPLYRSAFISNTWSTVLKHILTSQRTLVASCFRPKEVQTPQSAFASLSLSHCSLFPRLSSCMTLYAPLASWSQTSCCSYQCIYFCALCPLLSVQLLPISSRYNIISVFSTESLISLTLLEPSWTIYDCTTQRAGSYENEVVS